MIDIILCFLLIYLQYYHTHIRKLRSASNNTIHYNYNMIQNKHDNFTK